MTQAARTNLHLAIGAALGLAAYVGLVHRQIEKADQVIEIECETYIDGIPLTARRMYRTDQCR